MADQWLQPFGQWAVNIVVFGVFTAVIYQTPKTERKNWWVCLVLATLGEIVLSEVLGLYSYREGYIPLFVPPGHVLLYACGLWISKRLPLLLTWSVLILGIPYSVYCSLNGLDQMSVVLFILWVFMFLKAEHRPLMATMILLALAMEILGTQLGNWRWAESVAFLNWDLTQANPPFAAGVLYCGLDFLVGLISGAGNWGRTTRKPVSL